MRAEPCVPEFHAYLGVTVPGPRRDLAIIDFLEHKRARKPYIPQRDRECSRDERRDR